MEGVKDTAGAWQLLIELTEKGIVRLSVEDGCIRWSRRRRRRRRVCLDVGLINKKGNWISSLVKLGNMKTVLIYLA